jgi:asparagine N-glycosylation enzyme membrane subunit Stt3
VAEVTVFIDDAVLGSFPSLCVKEGIPTSDRLEWRESVGSFGTAGRFLLFGPIGWLLGARRQYVTAKLPFCEFAYRRLRVAQRMLTIWITFAVIAALLSLAALAVHSRPSLVVAATLGLGALGATVKAVIEKWRLHYLTVRLELDGSRRWLTISGVHPAFVQAVAATRADR